MSMSKCKSVGCHNEVAARDDRCSECKRNDFGYSYER